MSVECETCGNEISPENRRCPFCGSIRAPGRSDKKFRSRTINLEEGLPTVEQALAALDRALQNAAFSGETMLVLIHGYGSSGHGGAIRRECRKVLDYKRGEGEIAGCLAGEELTSRSTSATRWLQRYPQLRANSNYNRGNRGITLVFLR